MDSSIVVQMIETGGFVVITGAGMFFYWKLSGFRRTISREKDLLLDCYFYRQIIEKYKTKVGENGKPNLYQTFREEVEEKLEYANKRYSRKSEIKTRLNYLARSDQELSDLLAKIKFFAK